MDGLVLIGAGCWLSLLVSLESACKGVLPSHVYPHVSTFQLKWILQ